MDPIPRKFEKYVTFHGYPHGRLGAVEDLMEMAVPQDWSSADPKASKKLSPTNKVDITELDNNLDYRWCFNADMCAVGICTHPADRRTSPPPHAP
jgi:hypothetical protein